jgi:hypothetical protein
MAQWRQQLINVPIDEPGVLKDLALSLLITGLRCQQPEGSPEA